VTREEVSRIIAEYCAGRSEIGACYLFGSYARGKERPGSDVDVAFLLDASVPRKGYYDLKMSYYLALCELLRLDIHPLIMNDAGEVVLEQVFRKGIAVFGGDSLECIRFRMTQSANIAEFLPLRERMETALLRKYKEN
jgi:predicted nucleotidyltransferase